MNGWTCCLAWGSVSFVSQRTGAYGRLLLAVYVQCKTGLLVASDWLRPVTRGGGADRQPHQSQSAVRLTRTSAI